MELDPTCSEACWCAKAAIEVSMVEVSRPAVMLQPSACNRAPFEMMLATRGERDQAEGVDHAPAGMGQIPPRCLSRTGCCRLPGAQVLITLKQFVLSVTHWSEKQRATQASHRKGGERKR